MGSQHSPDLHLQYVYKQTIKKTPAQIRFYSKRLPVHTCTITKMNDNINVDCTIAGSVNASS